MALPQSNCEVRTQLIRRWGMLTTERASWLDHYKQLSDYLLPRSGRFFIQDRNKGNRRHNNIYDNTGTRAVRVLAAGMMAGMTSPARPWFRLGTSDPDMMKSQAVKIWCNDVTRMMLDVFQRSNTYRALHSMYEELGTFGTSASIVTEDFKNVIHHFPLTCGEYAIATDWKGDVCTLYREFEKTVAEIIKEFGYANCSPTVQSLYDRGSLDAWVKLVHSIEPREDRDLTKSDAKNKAWKSIYFEYGGNSDKLLSESGFDRFPAVVPRWSVNGGDIYGNSPGMEALGDIKQLQHQQLRKAQGIDYMTKPPLQMPSSMKNREIDTLPGGISYVDIGSSSAGIQTAFEVRLDLNHLLTDMQDVRGRINGAFYADLFLMLASGNNTTMTATEVAERHEEKMLMLGPVVERLQNELLDPLVDMTFSRMLAAGILPPPPPELQGVDLNVEYVSMLAQAQRAVGTNSVDRFVGNLGAVAQYKPETLDKFNADEWVDIYSDMLGVDPRLIVASDQVAIIRDNRAKAQAAQAQAEQANQAADTAQKLGNTPTTGGNAASDIMGMFSGYTTPQG